MILFLILVASEYFTFLAFRQHYKGFSRTKYYLSALVNTVLSIYLWILYAEVSSFGGRYDDPAHVWLMMNFAGAVSAILFPRVIFDILHFTGKLIRLHRNTHIRSLSNAGIFIWIIIFALVTGGSIHGKFNFKTENISVNVKGLNKDLDGFRIVQISDVHQTTFFRHKKTLRNLMLKINSYNPDLVINSGDFVEIGYNEFGRNDTIFNIAKGRYGNYAILGNHDIGTYYPGITEEGIDTNIARISKLITASGYHLLRDENVILKIGGARLGIAGTVTRGSYPNITHGDLGKAIAGLDSADFRILISHDPNHWESDISNKTNIDLTLSGHTHGMQMGILTKNFRWSPSKYFYKNWNGLYTNGKQFLYVNRGLGVIRLPFRIFMPPEITVITLVRAS